MNIRNVGMLVAQDCLPVGFGGRWLLAFFILLTAPLLAADKTGNAATRQELWVPTQQWETVLKKHPNAVMLTPEQYAALIRDAGKIEAPKPDESIATHAVVESLHFKGNATDENADFIKLDGEMTLRCLTDEWTEVTARMPFRDLASATVDGSVVLGLPEDIRGDKTGATQRKLLVRGKGVHRITMQVLARPDSSGLVLTHLLYFQAVDVPAVLDLQLPHGAILYSVTTSFTREGDTAHILLNGGGWRHGVGWFGGGSSTLGAVQTRAVGTTTITDHSIETAWEFNAIRSPTTGKVAFDVIPSGALVLSVESEGITSWQQNGDRLEVTMRDLTYAMLVRARVLSVLDLQASTTAQSIALPTLRIVGRTLKDVETRITSIAEGVTLMEYQSGTPSAQGVLTWNPVSDTPKLLLRRADPRVTVDADTHVTVTRDDVEIERTLMVQTDRPTNELRVTLPKGEEFLSTVSTQGPPMDWKRVDRVIEYSWPQALAGGQPCSLKLQTRKRLNPANQAAAASHALSVESLTIPTATKLAGYVALDFDPTWRVGLLAVPGLEERDARLTPVQGKMAWFGLRTYSLGFEVRRRDPVFDADITAYALPRAKTIEIEGQIMLTVSDAPLRQFKVAIAKESAGLVRFTSPLIGEQTLDAKTGVWSLTLRKESLGRIPVRFRLSLPASQEASAKSAEEVIKAMLPTLAVNAARRQRGIWVIEANTDTELTFETKIMQPLDVLRAPAIEDYQPLHRVVAAYEYATPDASLTVHAMRHGHSELAALIVNVMRLTSVLSHDGSARHEVVLDVHHSGEQFINIVLPPGYQLLTALADDRPVKPVRGPEGAISIPLPADSSNRPSVPVRLVYETTGEPWSTSGQRHLVPPALPGNIPILATDWRVFTPDGFSFKEVNTQMEQEGTGMAARQEMAVTAAPADVFLPGGAASGIAGRPQLERFGGEADAAVRLTKKLRAIRFPQVTFTGVTVDEAVAYLRVKSRDLDTDPDPARRGVNIILQTGDIPAGSRITLELKDVPMEEALRYVTELAGMKFKVEPYAVVVVPITESTTEIFTRTFKVPPDFLTFSASPDAAAAPTDSFSKPSAGTNGPKLMGQRSAKDMLIEAGIPFPEGASAAYDPATSQIVVRNTASNVDLVENLVSSLSTKDATEGEFTAAKAGLLTLDLDIPTAGQLLHFHGPLAPTALTLNYVSDDRQIVHAVVLMLMGALLFLVWGRRWPVLGTLLVLLVVSAGIGLITGEWQPLANAALLGWLGALVLARVWKLVRAFESGAMEGRQA